MFSQVTVGQTAGGLVGAFTYSLVYAATKPFLNDTLNLGKITIAQFIPLPEFVTALIVAVLLAAAAFALPKSASDRS